MPQRSRTPSVTATLISLAAALCLGAPAHAEDLTRAPAANLPPGALLTDRALTEVRGKGATDAPQAHQQVAVILWDERGGAPKASNASYNQSLGTGNAQGNRLTQN